MTVPVAANHPDVEQLRANVLRAIRRICPRWLAEQADDLAQIATSRLLDRIRATGGTLELSAGYLYRTAHSVVVDEIRRRRHVHEVPIEPDAVVQSRSADPERHAIGRQVRSAVWQCLAGIGRSRRRAVTLHLIGHSVAEIAALLECRRKQAENLVYRGLAELRTCLRSRGLAS